MAATRTVRFEPQCELIPQVSYSSLPRIETKTYAVPLPLHWGKNTNTTSGHTKSASAPPSAFDSTKNHIEDEKESVAKSPPRRLVVRVPSFTFQKKPPTSNVDPTEVKSCLARRGSDAPTPTEDLKSNPSLSPPVVLISRPPRRGSIPTLPTPSGSGSSISRRRNSLPSTIPTQTLPLRECCKDCLPLVERALSSANYEVMWSPGARRKKQLDDEEQKRDQELANYLANTRSNEFPRLKLLDELELCHAKDATGKLDCLHLAPFAEEETEKEDELAPLPSQTDSTSSTTRPVPLSPKRAPDAIYPSSSLSQHIHHNRSLGRRTASDSEAVFGGHNATLDEPRLPSKVASASTSTSTSTSTPTKPKSSELFSWSKGSSNIIKGLSSGGGGLITVG